MPLSPVSLCCGWEPGLETDGTDTPKAPAACGGWKWGAVSSPPSHGSCWASSMAEPSRSLSAGAQRGKARAEPGETEGQQCGSAVSLRKRLQTRMACSVIPGNKSLSVSLKSVLIVTYLPSFGHWKGVQRSGYCQC